MGLFSKLFKGPEIDMEKSNANAKKMRALFNQVVENGDNYRLIFGYTEDEMCIRDSHIAGRIDAIGGENIVERILRRGALSAGEDGLTDVYKRQV